MKKCPDNPVYGRHRWSIYTKACELCKMPKPLTAFESVEARGATAFAAGQGRDSNPYGDSRTHRGSVTFARAFWRAWNRGWDGAQKAATT